MDMSELQAECRRGREEGGPGAGIGGKHVIPENVFQGHLSPQGRKFFGNSGLFFMVSVQSHKWICTEPNMEHSSYGAIFHAPFPCGEVASAVCMP